MDDGREAFKREYYRYSLVRKLILVLLIIAVALISLYTATLTVFEASLSDVFGIIYDHLTGVTYEEYTHHWYVDYEVWNLCLPNIVFAIIAGAALALGGATMQSVINNPLADPYLSGVSSAACLGVAMSMVMGFSLVGGNLSRTGVFVNAFIFALIPIAIIIVMSSYRKVSPATIVLLGVALSSLFNALDTLILVKAADESLAAVYDWQIGSIDNLTWDMIPLVLSITLVCSVIIVMLSHYINTLSMGDSGAQSLGINVNRLRIVCLLVVSVLTAVVISFAGIIGFVGLVCPHIVRLLIGSDTRYLVPISMTLGSAVLVGAYAVSLTISHVGAIPVGVVMSFAGAPILLILIVRNRKAIW